MCFNTILFSNNFGIYAYKKSFLKSFCEQGSSAIEQAEGLEQLRALYLGARLKVLNVKYESWGVDIPEDIQRVEQELLRRRNEKQ